MPEPTGDSNTQLRCYSKDGDQSNVSRLLKEGADINSTNFHKNTALHMAVFYSHKDVVNLLLKQGAKLDIANVNGQTPLQLACCKGDLDIVKMITKQSCDLHATTDYSGMTALHFASKEGHAEVCQHLLDVGADEEVTDAVDQIAEYYAANYPTELVFKKYREKRGKDKSKANKKVPIKLEPKSSDLKQPTGSKIQPGTEKVLVSKVNNSTDKGQGSGSQVGKGAEKGQESGSKVNKILDKGQVSGSQGNPVAKGDSAKGTKKDDTLSNNTQNSVSDSKADDKGNAASAQVASDPNNTGTANKPGNKAVEKLTGEKVTVDTGTEKTSADDNSEQSRASNDVSGDENSGKLNSESNENLGASKSGKLASTSSEKISKTKNGNTASSSKELGEINHNNKKIPTYETGRYSPEGHGIGTHTPGGGMEIPKDKKETYDVERQKQQLADAAQRGNITLLKDHSFHWSEEHKSRMKLSVFDRLQGGSRKKAAAEEPKGKSVDNKPPAQRNKATEKKPPVREVRGRAAESKPSLTGSMPQGAESKPPSSGSDAQEVENKPASTDNKPEVAESKP